MKHREVTERHCKKLDWDAKGSGEKRIGNCAVLTDQEGFTMVLKYYGIDTAISKSNYRSNFINIKKAGNTWGWFWYQSWWFVLGGADMSFYRDTVRKARKKHKCDLCGAEINVGGNYHDKAGNSPNDESQIFMLKNEACQPVRNFAVWWNGSG